MINLVVAWLQARFAERDRGATAVEYGLIVALIAAIIVVTVALLGQQILTAFTTVTACLAAPAAC
jgi:pilus assembly protein Flp/PilA